MNSGDLREQLLEDRERWALLACLRPIDGDDPAPNRVRAEQCYPDEAAGPKGVGDGGRRQERDAQASLDHAAGWAPADDP
jgi:hypothetical protein